MVKLKNKKIKKNKMSGLIWKKNYFHMGSQMSNSDTRYYIKYMALSFNWIGLSSTIARIRVREPL
jgi:hypothetical protein